MILIAHKFSSYRSHQIKQNHAIELIKAVLIVRNDHTSSMLAITQLNALIRSYPIDCCYGFVRVFESSSEKIDLKLLESVNFQHAIDKTLSSLFHKNRAIAIEAIGLLKLHSYRLIVLASLDLPQYCPFAAEALIRLDGKAGIPKVLDCYQNKILSISQTLTALLQLNMTDLNELRDTDSLINIPNEFKRYLKS